MPIYEYTCRKCKAHIEMMQKISDEPLKRHAGCGGKLEKEWSQTSFQLKGSGWYVTDYAGRKQDAKEGTETKSEAATTEAKPAASTAETKTAGDSKSTDKSTGKKAAKTSTPVSTNGKSD